MARSRRHKVRCINADDPRCPYCAHAEPHLPGELDGGLCTAWDVCYDDNETLLFKVRCVAVVVKPDKEK